MNPDFWQAMSNIAQMVYYLVVMVLWFRVRRLQDRIEHLETGTREEDVHGWTFGSDWEEEQE